MADDENVYLVWSNEHLGWWCAGGWGYAPGLNHAGRFSRDQALKICREAIPTAAHLGRISEMPIRLADVREFLAGQTTPSVIVE